MIIERNIKRLLILTSFSILLSACSKNSAEDYLEEASQKQDKNASLVILKTAAQNYPENSQIRAELGKIHLQKGSTENAIKELLTAIELNPQNVLELSPLLLEAATLGKLYEDTLSYSENNDISNCSPCQLHREWALINTNKSIGAYAINDNATEAQKSLFSIVNAIVENPKSITKSSLDKIIQVNANTTAGEKLIAAEIALQLGMNETARAGFLSVFEARPNVLWLNLPIAQTYVSDNQYEEADIYINNILKISENNGLANYLKSFVFLNQLDYSNAAVHARRAVDYGYDTPQSRLALGISEYRISQYERALSNLELAANKLPAEHFANKMIIATKIKLGDGVSIANDLVNKEQLNSIDMLLLGQTLSQVNATGVELNQLVGQSISKNKDTGPLIEREAFLLNLLQSNIDDQAVINKSSELASSDKDLTMALVSHFLNIQNFAAAQKQLDLYLAEQPDDLEITNLLGAILIGQNKYEDAKSVFEKASKLSSNNAPSMYFNVLEQVKNKNWAAAIQRTKNLLNEHPLHLNALRILKVLVSNQNLNLDEPLRYAQKAVDTIGSNYSHKLILANIYVELGSASLANGVLNTVDDKTAQADNQYWEVKHFLAANLGTDQDVKANYQAWKKATPGVLNSVYRYADYLNNKRQFLASARVLGTVNDSHPEAYNVRTTEFYVLLKAKELTQAKRLLDKIQKLYPSAPSELLVGLLAHAENKKEQTLTALESFYVKTKTEESLLILMQMKNAHGQDTSNLLESHINDYPRDIRVINIYAESLIGKDNNKAASYYAKYVELVNNNPNAMNNYAWVLLQLGRLDEAVAYANRALALSPKDLAFTDTLASILIAKTSYKEAISLIEDVKAPTTDLTLALTQAYILDKQTNKAKMIITSINNEKLSAAQKTKLSELQKLI